MCHFRSAGFDNWIRANHRGPLFGVPLRPWMRIYMVIRNNGPLQCLCVCNSSLQLSLPIVLPVPRISASPINGSIMEPLTGRQLHLRGCLSGWQVNRVLYWRDEGASWTLSNQITNTRNTIAVQWLYLRKGISPLYSNVAPLQQFAGRAAGTLATY
ncbi:hypothetical protein BDZ91DRAFT_486449 [Kalaharituber pfeilii]|nr:hypothetical protein BDZ91DRAFT_486449 [Kalaharituber pfeilii]